MHRSIYLLLSIFILQLAVQLTAQSAHSSIRKIARDIEFNDKRNSLDSVKAIYAWITDNISYDVNRKFRLSTSRDTFTELAERVAREKKAVCLGYAALFKKLCDIWEIPAYVAKGRVYIPEEEAFENHAWVIFHADNHWHLADPTWGTGYVAGHVFTFNQNWAFFDAKPEEFIQTHYPFEPAFQLLHKPVTYEEFHLRNSHEYEVDSIFDYNRILHADQQKIDPIASLKRALQFKPDDPFLMHDLATYLQEEASSMVRNCISEYNRLGGMSIGSECRDRVHLAEKHILKAIEIYENLLQMNAPQKDTAWMNLAASKNNLKTIQILKQNVD